MASSTSNDPGVSTGTTFTTKASRTSNDPGVSCDNTIKIPLKGLHPLDVASSSPGGATDSPSSSPTSVNDGRLLLETIQEDQAFLPLIPVDIQQRAVQSYYHVQDFVQETKENFILDRKAITTMILSFLASLVGLIGVTVASIGGLLLVSCPIWLPIALLTLPLWLPLMLFTSPVWVTATVTLAVCGLSTCTFVLSVLFFFTWPADWLPAEESSDLVAWYLRQRDAATMYLAKLQTKLLLYAAGVGPASDALFLVMDKVDIQAIVKKIQGTDWKDFGARIKNGELQEVQRLLFEIVASLFQ